MILKPAQHNITYSGYLILSGEGCLTGCGLHGYSLVSILLLLLTCQSIVLLLLSRLEVEDYIMCELIG